jgi:predicted ester cyclase
LGDDEFLAINRDELVEIARRCYDAELARRQLAPAEPEPEEEFEEAPGRAAHPVAEGNLVTVAMFVTAQEANLARSVLQSADMPCVLTDEHVAAQGPYVRGSQRLMVDSADAEAARDLLQAHITESNKSLVERWLQEVWVNGYQDASAPAKLAELRAALPEFTVTVEDIFAEGDRVAARITVHGAGATEIDLHGICIARLDAGAIAESWVQIDPLP